MYNAGMRFTWDEEKAAAVSRRHGVDFVHLIDIFSDPDAIEFIDEAHSSADETRLAVIGLTAHYGLAYLVFTQDDESGDESGQVELRFITARRAEPWMVDEYEENKNRK